MDLVFCVGDSYRRRHFNLSENYSIILVTLEDVSPQAAFTEAAQPLTAHWSDFNKPCVRHNPVLRMG